MSLSVSHETTAETTAKEHRMKIPIIIIAVILLAIGGVIWYSASRPGDDTASTTTDAAPIQTPAQTPIQTPIQATPTAPTPTTEPGVVVLTVEELLSQTIQNPNRYKRGTVMQVTGITFPPPIGSDVYSLYLKSKVRDWYVVVATDIGGDLAKYLIKNYGKIKEGSPITVRGTFSHISQSSKYVFLENGVLVK